MKKRTFYIIIMILIIFIIGGSVFFYLKLKGNENSSKILFNEDSLPVVDASLIMQPLLNAFISNFSGRTTGELALSYTNNHSAYVKLINGEVDMIIATEPNAEEKELAATKGIEFEIIPLVKDGLVFYVNETNPIDALTLDQIRAIYAGEIKSWNEVGGNNLPIKPYQRPANTSSQTGFLSLVMKNQNVIEPLSEKLIMASDSTIDIVSDYSNNASAIGYSYYYYAASSYDTIASAVTNRLKFINVDGIRPTKETIKNNEYPLQTTYYIVYRSDEPVNSQVRILADACLSKRGQKIVESVGYVGTK